MTSRPVAFVVAICFAHVLTMLGFSSFPALLPLFTAEWNMSAAEGGAVNSAFFAGYTLAVPVLVSLTDRLDPRRVYLSCAAVGAVANAGFALFAAGTFSASIFTALYGVALAGTYMPGLKLLGEHLQPRAMARATAFYTSSFSLGAALSYVLAERIALAIGWHQVFLLSAAASAIAMVVVFAVAPPSPPAVSAKPWAQLFDPRHVLRNRAVMGYSICYGLHSLELFTIRAWIVAFLAATLLHDGGSAGSWTPAAIAALLTLLGVPASIGGNELAMRIGRRRLVACAFILAGLAALAAAGASMVSYALAATLCVVHGFAVMIDSAALTGGAFGAARPADRGITMAVHSAIGFGAAAVGPFVFGALVDLFGQDEQLGWAIAYAHLALVAVAGIAVLAWYRPPAVLGDRA